MEGLGSVRCSVVSLAPTGQVVPTGRVVTKKVNLNPAIDSVGPSSRTLHTPSGTEGRLRRVPTLYIDKTLFFSLSPVDIDCVPGVFLM